MKIKGLYVISAENPDIRLSHLDVCQAALQGGARIIQYREKNKKFSAIREEASQIKALCQSYNAVFIINDWVNLAININADGVHLGQDDTNLKEAKQALPGKIIGLSVETIEQAKKAEEDSANYISLGPILNTNSKPNAGIPVGTEKLRQIRTAVKIPLVAIGGINKENANSVIKAGAHAVAVISAIAGSEDMAKATRDLINICYEPIKKY